MWWNAIVMFTDSSTKRIDGRSRHATNTRSSCGSAWHNQAQYAAPGTLGAASATRAAWFQLNVNGMDTTLARQTATVQCGTCRTDWNY